MNKSENEKTWEGKQKREFETYKRSLMCVNLH